MEKNAGSSVYGDQSMWTHTHQHHELNAKNATDEYLKILEMSGWLYTEQPHQ